MFIDQLGEPAEVTIKSFLIHEHHAIKYTFSPSWIMRVEFLTRKHVSIKYCLNYLCLNVPTHQSLSASSHASHFHEYKPFLAGIYGKIHSALSTHSRVLLQKQIFSQVIENPSTFMEAMVIFTRSATKFSSTRWIQFSFSHKICLRSISILLYILLLGLASDIIILLFENKVLYEFLISRAYYMPI